MYTHEEDVTRYQHVWSIEYDGASVLAIADKYPKMGAKEIIGIILGEGGIIDDDGTIHRGSAKYQIAETDTSDALKETEARLHRHDTRFAWGIRLGRAFVDRSFIEAVMSDIAKEWQKDREENLSRNITAKDIRKALEKYGYYVNKEGIIKYNPMKAYKEGSKEWLNK